jgi:hypothetical protein
MKTKLNINQIASLSIASAALILCSAFAPVQAASGNDNTLVKNEIMTAIDRLDALNNSIEKASIFTVAEVTENAEAFDYEVYAAKERLENFSSAIEESVRFSADVDAEETDALDFEVYAATERLESLNLAIEQSIRFTAPSVSAF